MASLKNKQPRKGLVKNIVLQDLLNFSESSEDEQIPPKPSVRPACPAVEHDDGECGTHVSGKENALKGSALGKKAVAKGGGSVHSERKTMGVNSRECDSKTKEVSKGPQAGGSQKGKTKRTRTARGKPNPKISLELQNMTLADMGISFDFSESSADGEEKTGKEQTEVNKKGDLPNACKRRAKDNRKRTNCFQLKLKDPNTHASLKDKTEKGCKVNVQSESLPSATANKAVPSTDISGNNVHSSAVNKHISLADHKSSFNDLDVKKSTSDCKIKETAETVVPSVKSQQLKAALTSDGKNESDHNLKSFKFCLPLQHPDVSVIRSAHFTGSLMVVASPSEESLLPLSESTRLECPESATAPKQSFGHLLAHQNSPKLFYSPLGDSENSSYEQLKIVAKNNAPETQEEDNKAQSKQEKMADELKNSQLSGAETSESESQYMTCLATPDVSSMYEAVDVSVQTSFKFGVSVSTETEEVKIHSESDETFSDKPDSGELVKDVNLCEQYNESEDGIETAKYDESNSKFALDLGTVRPIDLKLEAKPVSTSEDKNYNKDAGFPVVITDDGTKRKLKCLDEQELGGKSYKKEGDAAGLISPNSEEARSKLASDSNYYSESHSDLINASGSPDIIHDSLQAENHKALATLHKQLQNMDLCCSVSEKEESGSREQEQYEVGGPAPHKSSPEASLLPSHKPRRDWNEENASGSSERWRTKAHEDSSSEDDSDEKLEAFFQSMRIPATPAKKAAENEDLDDFIVNDSDVTNSEEDLSDADVDMSPCDEVLFDTEDDADLCNSDDDDEDEEENDPSLGLATPRSKAIPTYSKSQTPREGSPKWYTPATSMKTKPKRREDSTESRAPSLIAKGSGKLEGRDVWATPSFTERGHKHTMKPLSFLRSLSAETPDHLRDEEARSYVSHFKRRQEELSSRLYKLFNFTVFENQLPQDPQVVWNKRLLKTAGLCKQKHVNDRYSAVIELSTKVCDTAERVRDTLVHEMCHAAVWILNKAKEGHGPHWRYWAGKANRAHPEIPVIRRCHDYNINTKYIYRCVNCGYQIGRHSKSLDTEHKVCGHCRGRFQLLTSGSRCGSSAASLLATPRTPNPFAMFVKENYGSVKREGGGLPHKEVMETLSREFAKTKINLS